MHVLPLLFALVFCLVSQAGAETPETEKSEVTPVVFEPETPDIQWRTQNDTVMGGVSQSRFEMTEEGVFVFTGNVSLENNGGFASVRARLVEPELEGATAFRLRVRGDGQKYELRFRVKGDWSWVSYRHDFETEKDEWVEVELPVEEFEAGWRGRSVPEAPAFDPAGAFEIGIMISDKQEGPFELEVDWIGAVKGRESSASGE